MRSFGPVRGVEQIVNFAFYYVPAIPTHAVGARFIETIEFAVDGVDIEAEKKDIPVGKQPRGTSILDVYKRSTAHVLSPDLVPYASTRGDFGFGELHDIGPPSTRRRRRRRKKRGKKGRRKSRQLLTPDVGQRIDPDEYEDDVPDEVEGEKGGTLLEGSLEVLEESVEQEVVQSSFHETYTIPEEGEVSCM